MLRKAGEFRAVAVFTIFLGAVIFALGAAAWYLNVVGGFNFFFPASKMIGGWIIVSLGYIHLSLELMRDKNSQ